MGEHDSDTTLANMNNTFRIMRNKNWFYRTTSSTPPGCRLRRGHHGYGLVACILRRRVRDTVSLTRAGVLSRPTSRYMGSVYRGG